MKSLELNWIRKKVDKTLVMPEVMFYPLYNAAGRYYSPQPYEAYDLDGKPYPMHNGLIVVNPDYEGVDSTIAHEWRHHWQYHHGIEFEMSSLDLFNDMSYEDALIAYFTESKTEFDAVRFEYQYAGLPESWEDILQDVVSDLRVKPIISYGNNTIKDGRKIQSRSSSIRRSHSPNQKARRISRRIPKVV